MEEELKCPACGQLFSNPVLLPCCHALCLHCAVHLQQPATRENSERDESSAGSEPSSDYQEVDKLSILSETDSGVVCTSRPNSYVGTPNIQGILSLACPVCHKVVYFDENGAQNLPKYRAMAGIVDKVTETRNLMLKCQLCETDPVPATTMCEQCEVLYCDACRETCHPLRGPLAKHSLVEPVAGRAALRARGRASDAHCAEHEPEPLSLFCVICKQAVCPSCLEGRHTAHDVQPIQTISKAQKTELSLSLQQLSEKARSTTEYIQRLKGMADKVNENCDEFSDSVSLQCDMLVQALLDRKQDLLDFIKQEKEEKLRALKEQVASCTCKLQQTTGLLQFCIEALKETDPVAFLQVGGLLLSRVAAADVTWYKDVLACSRVSPQFDLTLDENSVLRAIEQLNFIQMKPPNAPIIIPEECCAENNSVTIAWQQPPTSYVQGYVLELDDGNGGEFREVYCGKETICTVDGLHFNSMYNARVKAFNTTGEGAYSDLLGLQTAEVAWFTFDPCVSLPELVFSEDHGSLSCEGYEHRIALATVGFSRGVHYWEFIVNKFDSDTDPSFGVARLDVAKDQMLGKDDKGWSMYIDKKRSWFMHGGQHWGRSDGGIKAGSTVGVLLDLDRHQLSFYVNEEPQGPIAFQELYGVFYPAVSLNRGVSVTLHTAIDPPTDSDSS